MSTSADKNVRHATRRRVLGMVAAATVMPLFGPFIPEPARAAVRHDIRFFATHLGEPVGEHNVAFRPDGDQLTVITHIDIDVKVLFFTAFLLKHDAEEVWRSGRLVSLKSTTDDNGTRLQVSGYAAADSFRIHGVDGPNLVSARLLTSNTLWDSRLMQESTLIDVQHGSVVGLVTKSLGEEMVQTPQGPVRAHRHQVITPHNAGSMYYDGDGRWVKSLFEQQGEVLEYALAS